jgi:ppGpp synthetase/RelA/SpoT-type nucleotidyltranferase
LLITGTGPGITFLMPLPLTKSQIERLGKRLAVADTPADSDLTLLRELLLAHDDVLTKALDIVRDAGFSPTDRLKNTGTIVEKLRRHGGSFLKIIQDIAGMRIADLESRSAQDTAVSMLVGLFSEGTRPPQVIDRRANPSSGYRAVHVVIFLEDIPVEIQVRTRWQHEWADMYEKLADCLGRGIRYGEPPAHWLPPEERDTEIYVSAYHVREIIVEMAEVIAELISHLEEHGSLAEDDLSMDEHWNRVRSAIVNIRVRIAELEPVPARLAPGTVET